MEFKKSSDSSVTAKSLRYRLILVMFIIPVIIFAFGEVTGLRKTINIEFVRSLFEQHVILASVLFIGVFAIGNTLYIPGWIFLIGAVFAVGKFAAWPLAMLGALASCLLSYFVVGYFGKDALRLFEQNPMGKRFFGQIDQRPIRTIIFLRIIFQTAPILNYALIMSNVSFKHYMLGALLGLPLPLAFYCLFFNFIFAKYL